MECPACNAAIAASTPQCPHCGAVVTLDAAGRPAGSADPLRAALVETLGSQYDILRLLGRGAMGAVYLARERSLERLVAIKVLPFGGRASPDARERFRREARIAARFMHPNILPLYVFGEVGDVAYYVMGYVHGQSLGERLKMEGKIPSDTVRQILAQMADALDYAHRQGVVHRDVKPDNILIDDESGRPILADFGIAKTVSAAARSPATQHSAALTATGVAVGTPHYMSPEQALGEAVDGRSDIYALGVVAYEMLTGHTPFRATNVYDVMLQRMTTEPPSLQIAAPDCPGDLIAVVTRCLSKDPAMRWPDGRSLKKALAPDGEEEDVLPHDVSELIPGFGIWAAAWFVLWGVVAVAEYARQDGAPWLFALIALLNPIGFFLNVWSATNSGYRLGLVLRVSFWPPKWWGVWWPRAWQRPGSVFERLPRPVRLLRLAFVVFFVSIPALTYAARYADARAGVSWAGMWLDGARYGVVALTAAILLYGMWWARRQHVAWVDVARLLFGAPVGSSFWGRADISRLLAPSVVSAGGRRPLQPRSTHEYVGAIAELARCLTGPCRALGDEALAAARHVVRRIDALDADIRFLRGAADPDEAERLEKQIAELDAGLADGADHRAMREILANQLELVRRKRARLDEATARRAHLADLLRFLCAQLSDLRRHGPDETDASRQSADRVRSLCREAEQQTAMAGS